MTQPITAAIDILEDAVTQATGAAWDVLPVGTVRRLGLPAGDPAHLAAALVAHSQDAGGGLAAHVGSAGWAGLMTLRCYAPTLLRVRAGFAAAATAMDALASPSGYAINAHWQRPLTLPPQDGLLARAGIWRVTIRRAGGVGALLDLATDDGMALALGMDVL